MYKDKWKNYFFPAKPIEIPEKWILLRSLGKGTIDQFGDKFNLIFSLQNLNALQYLKIRPSKDGKGILNVGF